MEYKCLNGKTYANIIADSYLCVPAAITTIIKSEGYNGIELYDIANFLGVTLPMGVSYPKLKNITTSSDPKDFGVKIINNKINLCFSHFNIALKEEFMHINTLNMDFFDSEIQNILLSGKHIVVGFNYNKLYKLSDTYCGHVSIITGIGSFHESISLLDPGPGNPGLKEVDMYELYLAIKDSKDGLWIISHKQ